MIKSRTPLPFWEGSDDWDWDSPMGKLKLGLPNERMGPSGAYHCWMQGFMKMSIAPDFSFIQYQYDIDGPTGDNKAGVTHIRECKGLLQAFAMILQIIKEHGRTEFLPETVTDMDTNPEQGD